ncbi:MAG: hypothetical protein ACI8WB_004769 [Phenylobacterium sp.]|jgi:hypothetical protein
MGRGNNTSLQTFERNCNFSCGAFNRFCAVMSLRFMNVGRSDDVLSIGHSPPQQLVFIRITFQPTNYESFPI